MILGGLIYGKSPIERNLLPVVLFMLLTSAAVYTSIRFPVYGRVCGVWCVSAMRHRKVSVRVASIARHKMEAKYVRSLDSCQNVNS